MAAKVKMSSLIMNRRIFALAALAAAPGLFGHPGKKGGLSLEDYKIQLEIWTFEVRLNSYIPKRSLIEVNPHTMRLIRLNAHRFPMETREALVKDITLLLVVKENEVIASHAQRRGMKVYRNSFGKDEWPAWLDLLDDLAKKRKR